MKTEYDAGADVVGLTQDMDSMSLDPGDFTYDDLVEGIRAGTFKKILVMTGAGVSVSAGIPDFRSPGTGLYSQLEEYNLPRPEAIFTLDYFIEKPEPFYKFAQNFDLTKHEPTPTHYFIKMLQEKGLLWRCMTQNIDNLEQKAGMNMKAVVHAHGANNGAACARCRKQHDMEALQDAIREQQIMRCTECNSPVKPNIVFFGEELPSKFTTTLLQVWQADLCLIMGTALAVAPFNMIPKLVPLRVPKVLFNMQNTKETGRIDFTEPNRKRLFVQGKCDETIRKLAVDCGWEADFDQVLPDFHKQAASPSL